MSKIHLTLIFSLFGLFITGSSHAQNIDRMLDHAKELMDKGDFYQALSLHERLMRIDSNNVGILFGYGKNLSLIGNYKSASQYLLKAYKYDQKREIQMLPYELAESYRNSGDYRSARRYYSRAIRPYRRDRKSYWYRRIDQSKRSASWAIKESRKKTSDKVKAFGPYLNTGNSEFAPLQTNKNIYFSSLRADSVNINGLILDQDYFAQLYVYQENKKKTTQLKVEINKAFHHQHIGNLALGKEDEVFFSVCDTNFKCEIWRGQLRNNKISGVQKLNNNINTSLDNNTQAMWVEFEGEEYLYFVSDREKGFGGLDIWVSKREAFGFDQAINLGSSINTPGNEITPYYNTNYHQLYFSSDWTSGFGGYDIFKALGGPKSFEKSKNLGKDINSVSDDYYFTYLEEKALFSSNRNTNNNSKSGCCNDIYNTLYQEEEYLETDPNKVEIDVVKLNKYLPLYLYFHNDSPDPRSRSTSTNANYKELAKEYMNLQEEYVKKYSRISPDSTKDEHVLELEFFFEEQVQNGLKKLNEFSPLLLKELEKGSQIELTIKGFASSLSNSDYNLNLALRRIESLVNYFKNYDQNQFLPYLENSASNGGSLKITPLPYGEFATSGIYNQNNKVEAVYSPDAARERRIEVMAVTYNQEGEARALDDGSIQKKSELTFSGAAQSGNLELNFKQKEKHQIHFKNKGSKELELFAVNANCDCLKMDFPNRIQPGEESTLTLTIKGEEKPAEVLLTFFSNSIPNRKEIRLKLTY